MQTFCPRKRKLALTNDAKAAKVRLSRGGQGQGKGFNAPIPALS